MYKLLERAYSQLVELLLQEILDGLYIMVGHLLNVLNPDGLLFTEIFVHQPKFGEPLFIE